MKTPVWVIKDVVARDDHTLLLTFADGTMRRYDARPLLDKAIFSNLKQLPFFKTAHVDGDTVVWNDDIDIAPEHLYECSLPIS